MSDTVNPTLDSVNPESLVVEDVKAPVSSEPIKMWSISDLAVASAKPIVVPMAEGVMTDGVTPAILNAYIPKAVQQGSSPNSMARANNGKPPMRLIPPSLDRYLAAVLDYGAKKYAENNWRKGGSWLSAYDSLKRHMDAWLDGEEFDAESGLPHLAHMAFGIMVLVEFYDADLGTDDRFKYPTPVTRKELHFNEPVNVL